MNPPAKQPVITAVFATFNRKELVLGAVAAVLRQSYSPCRAVVVVNASVDGTAAALRDRYGSDSRVVVIELGENLGSTAGIRVGIRRALEDGSDWIWILDDDGWPKADTLHHAAARGFDSSQAISTLVLDPKSGQMSFPIMVIEHGRERLVETLAELPAGDWFEVRGTWLGVLLSREIISTVGEVDDRLFIRGDDEEYSARIRAAGYRFMCSKNAIVEHPGMIQMKIRLFGKYIFYEPGLPLWKAFYEVRNRIYIRRTFSKNALIGYAKALVSCAVYLALALFCDDRRIPRVLTYIKAAWHGMTGRLGKTMEPR